VMRIYILFISDYEMSTPWNSSSIKGCARFLDKVEALEAKVNKEKSNYSPSIKILINNTIKGVSSDMEEVKFNTAIAKLMILTNELSLLDEITIDDYETLLKLLNPFAPHMAEELYSHYHQDSIQFATYPVFDPNSLLSDTLTIVVSINGKVKDRFSAERGLSKEALVKEALSLPKIKEIVKDGYQKIIVIPDKLINIVL